MDGILTGCEEESIPMRIQTRTEAWRQWCVEHGEKSGRKPRALRETVEQWWAKPLASERRLGFRSSSNVYLTELFKKIIRRSGGVWAQNLSPRISSICSCWYCGGHRNVEGVWRREAKAAWYRFSQTLKVFRLSLEDSEKPLAVF